MKIVLLLLVALVSSCASEPPAPQAFIAIASNAKVGDMMITAIDGQPVEQSDGVMVPAGSHNIKFACKLDNGISATFATDTELLANHSYCFFSSDQGQSCRILYTRIEWGTGAVAVCD
jgi:hypothetical protein